MPRTGRPSKPIEQKRALGKPGHRPLPKPSNVIALAPVVVLPASPEPASGDDLVARILATSASAWIAEPDRVGMLTLLRHGWDEWQALGQLADQCTPRDALLIRKAMRDLEKQITTWLSLLGLSPTDRSRLGVAEVKARSKLEELRARREARGLHAG